MITKVIRIHPLELLLAINKMLRSHRGNGKFFPGFLWLICSSVLRTCLVGGQAF